MPQSKKKIRYAVGDRLFSFGGCSMLAHPQMETLIKCVKLTLLATMHADGIGNPIKMLREAQGTHQFFQNAKEEYKAHPVVINIIKTLEFRRTDGVLDEMVGIPTQEELFEQLMEADKILEGKDDAQAFRSFLYQLAMTVANAHGNITEREREVLDMLKSKEKKSDKV
jgi:hypothetical protein